MVRKIISVFLILLFIPLISADIIGLGAKPIPVHNYITNINEFPNYVFVSGPSKAYSGPLCQIANVTENGKIVDGYYKGCSISVYAIKKGEYNPELTNFNDRFMNYTLILQKFSSLEKIKVIEHLQIHTEVPVTSTKKEITNYYEVDLSKMLRRPSEIKADRSIVIYFYIFTPLVALIIFFWIIKRRLEKENA